MGNKDRPSGTIMTIKLRYRGKQYYDIAHKTYDKLYDVLSPISGYNMDKAGYVPTFTLETLKSKGLIPNNEH
jgi:hypothetical protein